MALTFIYASCADTCPLLTAKMAGLQARLGTDFGTRVFFASVTVDPERDRLEVLKRYAQTYGATPAGWAFLTGTPVQIQQVARHYGIFYKKTPRGDVDHTFLTSLIDHNGTLRVQYRGYALTLRSCCVICRPWCGRRLGHDSLDASVSP